MSDDSAIPDFSAAGSFLAKPKEVPKPGVKKEPVKKKAVSAPTATAKKPPVKRTKTTTKPRQPGDRAVKRGQSGDDVRHLQGKLRVSKRDGKFGPVTEKAVRRFQRQRGLASDGVAGERTWKKLLRR